MPSNDSKPPSALTTSSRKDIQDLAVASELLLNCLREEEDTPRRGRTRKTHDTRTRKTHDTRSLSPVRHRKEDTPRRGRTRKTHDTRTRKTHDTRSLSPVRHRKKSSSPYKTRGGRSSSPKQRTNEDGECKKEGRSLSPKREKPMMDWSKGSLTKDATSSCRELVVQSTSVNKLSEQKDQPSFCPLKSAYQTMQHVTSYAGLVLKSAAEPRDRARTVKSDPELWENAARVLKVNKDSQPNGKGAKNGDNKEQTASMSLDNPFQVLLKTWKPEEGSPIGLATSSADTKIGHSSIDEATEETSSSEKGYDEMTRKARRARRRRGRSPQKSEEAHKCIRSHSTNSLRSQSGGSTKQRGRSSSNTRKRLNKSGGDHTRIRGRSTDSLRSPLGGSTKQRDRSVSVVRARRQRGAHQGRAVLSASLRPPTNDDIPFLGKGKEEQLLEIEPEREEEEEEFVDPWETLKMTKAKTVEADQSPRRGMLLSESAKREVGTASAREAKYTPTAITPGTYRSLMT